MAHEISIQKVKMQRTDRWADQKYEESNKTSFNNPVESIEENDDLNRGELDINRDLKSPSFNRLRIAEQEISSPNTTQISNR